LSKLQETLKFCQEERQNDAVSWHFYYWENGGKLAAFAEKTGGKPAAFSENTGGKPIAFPWFSARKYRVLTQGI